MPDMPTAVDNDADRTDWSAEADRQAEIAAQIEETTPQVAGTPAEPQADEEPQVTLRSVNVDSYPLSVSVVGVEDYLVFDDADSTVDVSRRVAEQTTYLDQVEVAE